MFCATDSALTVHNLSDSQCFFTQQYGDALGYVDTFTTHKNKVIDGTAAEIGYTIYDTSATDSIGAIKHTHFPKTYHAGGYAVGTNTSLFNNLYLNKLFAKCPFSEASLEEEHEAYRSTFDVYKTVSAHYTSIDTDYVGTFPESSGTITAPADLAGKQLVEVSEIDTFSMCETYISTSLPFDTPGKTRAYYNCFSFLVNRSNRSAHPLTNGASYCGTTPKTLINFQDIKTVVGMGSEPVLCLNADGIYCHSANAFFPTSEEITSSYDNTGGVHYVDKDLNVAKVSIDDYSTVDGYTTDVANSMCEIVGAHYSCEFPAPNGLYEVVERSYGTDYLLSEGLSVVSIDNIVAFCTDLYSIILLDDAPKMHYSTLSFCADTIGSGAPVDKSGTRCDDGHLKMSGMSSAAECVSIYSMFNIVDGSDNGSDSGGNGSDNEGNDNGSDSGNDSGNEGNADADHKNDKLVSSSNRDNAWFIIGITFISVTGLMAVALVLAYIKYARDMRNRMVYGL